MNKLPRGWKISSEKYQLENSQQLSFAANLISPRGKVISVFDTNELTSGVFDLMIHDYEKVTNNLKLKKTIKVKIGEREFKLYIISDELAGCEFVQTFVEGEKNYCLITHLDQPCKNFAELSKHNPSFEDLVILLRSSK